MLFKTSISYLFKNSLDLTVILLIGALKFFERIVLSYGKFSSSVIITISPSKPPYLNDSAADNPAGPPPIITNLLLSFLVFFDIGIYKFLFKLSFGTFICNFPSYSVISYVESPS